MNNAGIYEFAPLEQITAEHFHKQFDLNVLGLLLTTQKRSNISARRWQHHQHQFRRQHLWDSDRLGCIARRKQP